MVLRIPDIWNHISSEDGSEYLIGIKTDIHDVCYNLIVTDLSNNFWIESVDKTRLITKLDENGIDIIQDTKRVEFLQFLQNLVDSDKNSYRIQHVSNGDIKMEESQQKFEIVPLLLTIKLSSQRLNWNFTPSLQRDFDDVDKLFKYQLFNTINIQQRVVEELRRQITLKDRILQTLLEHFMELNDSYTSSLDDDDEAGKNVDFKRKVETNKQLSRIIPNSSNMRNALFKFKFDEIYKFLQNDDVNKNSQTFIWNSITKAILDKKIWQFSNCFTEISNKVQMDSTMTTTPIPVAAFDKSALSEFVNFEDLPSSKTTRTSSPKRNRLEMDDEKQIPITKIETPSPTKQKVFGVIGGKNLKQEHTTPSRKRKLKASTNSPIKAPRLI